MTVIDSHLHLWDRSVSEYAWITPDLGPLYADFGPDDARNQLDAAGVGFAILVQAEDSLADTRHLLAIARDHAWVAGVVGWVPLDEPHRAAATLEQWAEHPVLRGVRQLVHNDPRDDLLDNPRVLETLRLIARAGLAFDVPDAWPRHLGAVTRVADAVPDLAVVVDHLGKPPVDGFEAWEAAFRHAAARPNTVAKVSGMQGLPPATLDRAWQVALDAFGPYRLMYGSDWPMTVSHGGYRASWEALTQRIDTLSPPEREQLYSGTATRAYRLGL